MLQDFWKAHSRLQPFSGVDLPRGGVPRVLMKVKRYLQVFWQYRQEADPGDH